MKEVGKARTIHPKILEKYEEKHIIELLSIAADLRAGKIAPENFEMGDLYWDDRLSTDAKFFFDLADVYETAVNNPETACNTPCCILGHLRMRIRDPFALGLHWGDSRCPGLNNLFDARNSSDPQKAADAIEKFVYENASNPWDHPNPYY